LFPTDGSEASKRTFPHAVSQAEAFDARVHVPYVVNTTYAGVGAGGSKNVNSLRAEGEEVIEEFEQLLRDEDVDVVTRIEEGDPYTKITKYADEETDMIVTRGREGAAGSRSTCSAASPKVVADRRRARVHGADAGEVRGRRFSRRPEGPCRSRRPAGHERADHVGDRVHHAGSVDGAALGHDWTENGSGVLNVTASGRETWIGSNCSSSSTASTSSLPNHADRVDLTPEQARTVAAELTRYADRIEADEGGNADPTDGADAERASRTATRSFKPARGYRRP